jgi:Family of unknown function (DUF5681)
VERNKFGQFEKGTCGNPRGRPRKLPPEITDQKVRQDFFDVAETPIKITENGKIRFISAHMAIDKQLVKKALSGETRAMCEYYKRRDRLMMEHVKEQLDLCQQILNYENHIRRFPEDVTDEFKRLLGLLKAQMDPYFRMP